MPGTTRLPADSNLSTRGRLAYGKRHLLEALSEKSSFARFFTNIVLTSHTDF